MERTRLAGKENVNIRLKKILGVTNSSLQEGLVPWICPICGNPPLVYDDKFLVIHHWGSGSKLEAIQDGRYRRMCRGCNSYLGICYGLSMCSWYFPTWEEQFETLSERFRNMPKVYPHFGRKEEAWSKFLPKELEIVGDAIYG